MTETGGLERVTNLVDLTRAEGEQLLVSSLTKYSGLDTLTWSTDIVIGQRVFY